MPIAARNEDNAGVSGGRADNLQEVVRLKSAKSKRSQIKGASTRLLNFINDVIIEDVSLFELRQRLHKFMETWDQFNAVQEEIEEIETEADDRHEDERREFENKYFEITSRLEAMIAGKTTTSESDGQTSGNQTPISQASNNSNNHLKLPRINLPTFSGEIEEWITFKNMFTSMIDKNMSLPITQKMQYLISSLEGEARDIISSLEASEENYKEAWKLLKERYDDSKLIIQRHIKVLFELPILVKQDHTALRQLLDGALKHVRALKALNRPTDQWDDIIVYFITSRIDRKTNEAWQIASKEEKNPTFKQISDFLSRHCRALEASSRNQATTSGSQQTRSKQHRVAGTYIATSDGSCAFCKVKGHAIYKCNNYLRLQVNDRVKEAKSRGLCLNCLGSTSHRAARCNSGRRCHKRHNTLLHSEASDAQSVESTSVKEAAPVIGTSHALFVQSRRVMLATAVIGILDVRGNERQYRALLDSGSQSCFITTSCAKTLGLKLCSANISVCGLGAVPVSAQVNHYAKVILRSRMNDFETNLNCLVIDRITQQGTINSIDVGCLQIPRGIQLADPDLCRADDVDLLLEAEIFFELLCIGKIKVSKDQPIWQKTVFGWIASGGYAATERANYGTACHLITDERLNASIARFWQVEHDERQVTRSPSERYCERHFIQTYGRNADGRFIVTLPLKDDDLQKLGESKEMAIRRFKNLEKRLQNRPDIKDEYRKFIHEYLNLQHMREVKQDDPTWNVRPQYYMPHHCVIKETSNTTKLRVVFDASSKDNNGTALNDILMVGPVLQQNLFTILVRFRKFKYTLTADIAKMYRQVLVQDSQTALQRIVWRDEPTEDIKTYELLTLTYGTSPASFLATKVIEQLAILEEEKFPVGAMIARKDFYMDDLLTGADSLEEALEIRDQTTALLAKGGFTLREWTANNVDLLQNLSEEFISKSLRKLDRDDCSRTLGIG